MSSESTQSTDSVIPREAPNPPENPVLRELAWKPMWVEDSNAVWAILGDPGDGKSWASLRIAEQLDPDFSVENVASDIVEFMELVMDDDLGQGSVIVLEEGGVEASAYDWYSESNQVFRTILETWRYQNRMAIINLPNFQTLDKGARRRTDVIIEMVEAKPWKDYSTAKPKEVNYNNVDDYFTTPYPILDGKRWTRLRFSPPTKQLRDDYEQLKMEYNSSLEEDLYQQLVDAQEEAEDDTGDQGPQEVADEILTGEGVDAYIQENHGQRYIDTDLIELEYGIGARKSSKVKKVLLPEVDDDVM